MPNSKQIVYLSQAQYAELIANGSITVDGVTVTYDENDIYVTPQAEPVTDVRINGTSIAANGVAEIPVLSQNVTNGLVHTNPAYGTQTGTNGLVYICPADYPTDYVRGGTEGYRPIVPKLQHRSTFYGLAKAAGDTTQSQSSNEVGIYTPEAKAAIQQMLGVSDLIAPTEDSALASKAYNIGDVFTTNGKLYKVVSVIAIGDAIVLQNEGETVAGANAVECKATDYAVHDVQVNGTSVLSDGVANIPVANGSVPGVIAVRAYNDGLVVNSNNQLTIVWPTDDQIKGGTQSNRAINPQMQHISTFYGLAKASGDTTQASSSNAVGTYTESAKTSIRNMLGAASPDVIAVQDTQPTNTDTKVWLPET